MDILLWRHAQAYPIGSELTLHATADRLREADLKRSLTQRGKQQAQRMCNWIDEHSPQDTRVFCSPALRCVETAEKLSRKKMICSELAPHQDVQTLLRFIAQNKKSNPIIVLGHQPTLGQAAAQLLGVTGQELSIRKCSLWWFRERIHLGASKMVLYTTQTHDLLW